MKYVKPEVRSRTAPDSEPHPRSADHPMRRRRAGLDAAISAWTSLPTKALSGRYPGARAGAPCHWSSWLGDEANNPSLGPNSCRGGGDYLHYRVDSRLTRGTRQARSSSETKMPRRTCGTRKACRPELPGVPCWSVPEIPHDPAAHDSPCP